ncbi:MAG: ABC transporter substrate-binding protein, partial [bacterium]
MLLSLLLFFLSTVPQRVISLAPNITEILFALNAQNSLIAVSDYCDYPPEAKKLPKLGGVLNFHFEKIRSMKPDLVLMLETKNPDLRAHFQKLHIPVEEFTFETLQDIERGILRIGSITGKEKEAREWAEKIKKLREKKPPAHRMKVAFVIHREPDFSHFFLAGKPSFIGELLIRAGGVPPDCSRLYCSFSLEALVQFAPEVILEFSSAEGKS